MLYHVKEIYSDRIPTDEDLMFILSLRMKEDGYIVRLWWYRYGRYELLITPDMTLEDCKAKMPKIYPV